MVPYKVLLPIETTARELLYKLTLSGMFAQYRYECYVGTKYEIYKLFTRVKPFVYFDKGYHPIISEGIYQTIRDNGGLIVNLDEEGGVDFKDSNTIGARYPESIFDLCDFIFFWGKAQSDFIKSKRNSFNQNKTAISGHPRFELLKPEFHGLYQKDVDLIRKRFGKYILFNTNMSFGNNIRGDEFAFENYGTRVNNVEKIMTFDKIKIKKFISIIKKISLKTKLNIILRPHPEENSDIYKAAFSDMPNIHVIYEGSVIPWLIGAEVMVHPDCTTGIESLMIGKRSLSFMPECDEKICTYGTVELSKVFDDEDLIVDYLAEQNYSGEKVDTIDPILEMNFGHDRRSLDIIVDTVRRLTERGEHGINKRDLSAIYSIKATMLYWMKKSYYTLVQKGSYALQQNKIKGLNPVDVHRCVALINSQLMKDSPVVVDTITPHLYKISLN